MTYDNSWDTSADSVIAECLNDKAYNDTIKAWIGRAADYIATLRDDDGNLLPVVFRPWHEHTGSWFWWCEPYCTPDQYKALWHLTREVFDQKGLNNIVWAYSPDKSGCATVEDYMRSYPGDDYVDILGADVYHFNGEEGNAIFCEWMHNMMTFATEEAHKRGKIAALTEGGSEGCKLDNWYTEVLYPEIKDYDIAYVTMWRNAYYPRKEGHFYTPYPGHHAVPDFVNFYNLPRTAFLNEIKDIE